MSLFTIKIKNFSKQHYRLSDYLLRQNEPNTDWELCVKKGNPYILFLDKKYISIRYESRVYKPMIRRLGNYITCLFTPAIPTAFVYQVILNKPFISTPAPALIETQDCPVDMFEKPIPSNPELTEVTIV